MAIIEKEKALDVVRQMVADGQVSQEVAEKYFPELKESEEEQSKKWILEYLHDGLRKSDEQFKDHFKAAIAWLEKQSTPQVRTGLEWVNTIDDACDKRYSEEYAHGEYCHEQSFKWGFQEGVDWLEKQGETSPILSNSSNIGKVEQKLADKIEPKFKVGNKIKLAKKPKYPAREIIAIKNDAYYFDELVYLPFSRQDEWELVEQKPAETEKGTKGNNGEIPNSTWSEEDEKIFSDIIKDLVHPWNEYIPDRIEDEIKWLKNKLNSLRPHSQWKPSNEQMHYLYWIANVKLGDSVVEQEVSKHLNELYQDLKKLSGE